MWRAILSICVLVASTACVSFPDAPAPMVEPRLSDSHVVSLDGAQLGLQSWQADEPKAVIIALHGMNDYANAFAGPGAWWAEHAGLTTYAYDQRGFGRSPNVGRWPGRKTLAADLHAVVDAVSTRHPDAPIFVLGHSMGAAVVMATDADDPLDADGLILAAPGIWGGRALPIPYRLALGVSATLAPGKTLIGERAERQSTDNIEILREMYKDPLVIKGTRIDAILGVVRLMGNANHNAEDVTAGALFLLGEKDEIIPVPAMEKVTARMQSPDIRRYAEGWHLLFRDLQAETVWRDVARWIEGRMDGRSTQKASISDGEQEQTDPVAGVM